MSDVLALVPLALLIKACGGDNSRPVVIPEPSNEIEGTDSSDPMIMGAGRTETINGLKGDDVLEGRGGGDLLDGGDGEDTASYSQSPDAVTVSLAAGVAGVGGDAEGDTLKDIENLRGSAHADVLTGNDGNNEIAGGDGNDVLSGGAGADEIAGDGGWDTADYGASSANVWVDLQSGHGSGGHAEGDRLSGVENLQGSNFDDYLAGSAEANELSGGVGKDVLLGRGGADTLDGGAGEDEASYAGSSARVRVTLGDGSDQGSGAGGDAEGDVLVNVENIRGSSYGDILVGNGAANRLISGKGNDTLTGGAGADVFVIDAYHPDADNEVKVITDFVSGTDLLDLTGLDAVPGVPGAQGFAWIGDAYFGADASGQMRHSVHDGHLVLSFSVDSDPYAELSVILQGVTSITAADVLLPGYTEVNRATPITAVDKDGNLVGTGGADYLLGGVGRDNLIGGSGPDVLDGGPGYDTADYSASFVGVTVNLDTGAGVGGDAQGDQLFNIENLVGSALDDQLVGNDYDNRLVGGAGSDNISGGLGNDVFVGGSGSDTMDGGIGDDLVDYSASASGIIVDLTSGVARGGDAQGDVLKSIEHLVGTAKNDALTGNSANNWLVGGGGADEIDGKGGSDTVDYSASSSAVVVELVEDDEAPIKGIGGDAQGDLLWNVENIVGSARGDELTGNSSDNTLTGGGGGDDIDGGGGSDTVDYRASALGVVLTQTGETDWAGAGGDADGDTLENIENIIGTRVDDDFVLDTTGAELSLDGAGGVDGVSFAGLAAGLTVNLTNIDDYEFAHVDWDTDVLRLGGFENVIGSGLDDALTGNGYSNILDGGEGDDSLHGGGGDDVLLGGAGDDYFVGGGGADVLNGGAGFDYADYYESTRAVTVTIHDGKTTTGVGGEAHGDQLTGIEHVEGAWYAHNNYLRAIGNGNHTLTGGFGNDVLVASEGADELNGALFIPFPGHRDYDVVDYSVSNEAVTVNLNHRFMRDQGGKLVLDEDDQPTLLSHGTGGYAEGDTLFGIEAVVGSVYDDILVAASAGSELSGSLGDDILFAGEGVDFFAGGELGETAGGGDWVSYGASDDRVIVNLGVVTTTAGGFSYSVGEGGHAEGDGLAGIENLAGSEYDDILTGNDSDNRFIGGDGGDKIDGGKGVDTMTYRSDDAVTVDLSKDADADGFIAVSSADDNVEAQGDLLKDVEKIVGGGGDDVFTAGAGGNVLVGGAGNDTIVAGSGGDTLDGGTFTGKKDNEDINTDVLGFSGTKDSDDKAVGVTVDLTASKAGADGYYDLGASKIKNFEEIRGTDGDDVFEVGGAFAVGGTAAAPTFAPFNIDGGKGKDEVDFSSVPGSVDVKVALNGSGTAGTVSAFTDVETVIGGSGDDAFEAASGVTVAFTLDGKAGDDTLTGGDKDDMLAGGTGEDVLDGGGEGDGGDTADYSNSLEGVTVDLEDSSKATGTGGDADGDTLENIENIIGSADDDDLTGNGDNNYLEGGAGVDVIDGEGGTDTAGYAGSTEGVTIDLSGDDAVTTGVGGDADGDELEAVENIIGSKTGENELTGDDEDNALTGGDEDDVLVGGEGADTLVGGDGDDELTGGEAGDTDGDTEDDVLKGGAGRDTLLGGDGDDTLLGGKGNDSIDGGDDDDGDVLSYADLDEGVSVELTYTKDDVATKDKDEEARGANSDTGDTIKNVEHITGSNFDDELIGDDNIANTLIGGKGDDTLDGGDDTEADEIIGGDGDDVLIWRDQDEYDGGGGADTLSLENFDYKGKDGKLGGADPDDAADKDNDDNVDAEVDLSSGDFDNIESVTGGEGVDEFTGDGGKNTLSGEGHNDTLEGGAGDDVLNGGDDDDTLDGGAGKDMLDGGDGKDTLTGGAGKDTLEGGRGDDSLVGGADADRLDGGAGEDLVDYSGDSTAVTVALDEDVAGKGGDAEGDVLVDVEHLIGTSGDDVLTGDGGDNALMGGGGDDTIVSGGGDDVLDGGGGTNTVSFKGASAVEIDLGADGTKNADGTANAAGDYIDVDGALVKEDTFTHVVGSSRNDTLKGDGSGNTLTGGDGRDTLMGEGGNDILVADAGDDLYGGGGTDVADYSAVTADLTFDMVEQTSGTGATAVTYYEVNNRGKFDDDVESVKGGSGDDTFRMYDDGGNGTESGFDVSDLDGGKGIDTLDYSEAPDTEDSINVTAGTNIENIIGGEGDDNLTGNTLENTLTGGKGDDVLGGDDGDDLLLGGDGDDELNGGDSNDLLIGGEGIDDFDGGADVDTLDLSGDNHNGNDETGVTVDLDDGSIKFKSDADANDSGVSVGTPTDREEDVDNVENVIATSMVDTLIGDGEDNLFEGGGDADILDGKGGSDTASYAGSSRGVTVDLSDVEGDDPVVGTGGDADDDELTSFENLIGGSGDDVLTGDDGKNVIQGHDGGDELDGGADVDTVSYSLSDDGVTVNIGDKDKESGGHAAGDELKGFENITGSGEDDVLTGDAGVNSLVGGSGDDILAGAGKGDDLNGGAGSDTVSYASSAMGVEVDLSDSATETGGDAAGDTLTSIENITGSGKGDELTGDAAKNALDGGAGDDVLDGGAEDDVLTGGAGDDVLTGGAGGKNGDALNGGAGSDTADYSESSAAVTVTLDGDTEVTGTGGDAEGDTLVAIENLIGTSGKDALTGDDEDNVFEGGAEDDVLVGGKGSDTLSYADSSAGVTVDLSQDAQDNSKDKDKTNDKLNGYIVLTGAGGDAAGDAFQGFENLTGSAANDELTGDAGANTLKGGDGDDELAGGAGDDVLVGGDGVDKLNGGLGSSDTASYEGSDDGVTIELLGSQTATGTGGDAEDDELTGIENLVGSSKADVLTGDGRANTLNGGGGDDELSGGGGADHIDGGAGTDTVSYAGSDVGVEVSLDGAATGAGGEAKGDTLVNIERLVGTRFDDTLTGGAGDNTFVGGKGADKIDGAGNSAGGGDWLDYSGSSAGVTVALTGATESTGAGGEAAGDLISNIENIIGTSKADKLTGDGGANIFNAGAGGDVIDGGGGVDTVDYSGGAAVTIDLALVNKAGYVEGVGGDARRDRLKNVERIIGTAGLDWFGASAAADDFQGGLEEDTVSYASSANAEGVTVNLSDSLAESGGDAAGDKLKGIENVIGTSKDDILTGDGKDNKLFGGAGDDSLIGGAGEDALDGGAGTDTVDYSGSSVGVTVDLSDGAAETGGDAAGDDLTGIENLVGSDKADTLTGDAKGNVFIGGEGNDTLTGGDGKDTLIGGAGDDVLSGGDKDDDLMGGDGVDELNGGDGKDSLKGGDGDDTLNGDAGNDVLIGGAGMDTLDGGDDVDTADYKDFVLASGQTGISVDLTDGSLSVIVGELGGDGNDPADLAEDELDNIENLIGTGGDDILTGDSEENKLVGGEGDDKLDGGADNDVLVGGEGGDTIDGGAGTEDLLDYSASSAGVTVDLSQAVQDNSGDSNTDNDALNGYIVLTTSARGDASKDAIKNIENLLGSDGNDKLTGDDKDNVLTGGEGRDTLDGGAGDDTLIGGEDRDSLIGGKGDDLVDYSGSKEGVTVDLVAGSGKGGDAEGDTLSIVNTTTAGDLRIENLKGTDNADFITSAKGANELDGGGGVDTISYIGSDAAVDVDLGSTSAQSGGHAAGDELDGFENIIGSKYDDVLEGADDVDNILRGGAGDDEIDGGGGTGVDTADFSDLDVGGSGDPVGISVTLTDSGAATVTLVVNKADVAGVDPDAPADDTTNKDKDIATDTLTDIENLIGTSGEDILTGSDEDNVLAGGGDADVLTGGKGNDTADYSASSREVEVNLATGSGTGGDAAGDVLATIENLIGSDGDDELTGDSLANTLTGGEGDDTLTGGGRSDTLIGGAGKDDLDGGTGGDLADYSASDFGVTIDLTAVDKDGYVTVSSADEDEDDYVVGDRLRDVEHLTGSKEKADWFVADAAVNRFTGGTPTTPTTGPNAGIAPVVVDVVDYSKSDSGVTVDLSDADAETGGYAQGDVLTEIEKLVGSSKADELTGDGNNNVFVGGGGADEIDGKGGSDTVDYSASDKGVTVDLTGAVTGAGGDAKGDTLTAIENFIGSAEDDSVVVTAESTNANQIEGGKGDDTVDYRGSTAVTVDLSATDKNGFVTVGGGAAGDKLHSVENVSGTSGDDVLTGDDGGNTLDGGLGDDTLVGGKGDDVLRPGTGDDKVDGGLGTDTVDYSTATGVIGSDTASVNIGEAFTSIENIVLSGHGNYLTGDDGDNTFEVITTGSDGAGDDAKDKGGTVIAARVTDELDGGEGTDTADFSRLGEGVATNAVKDFPANPDIEVVVTGLFSFTVFWGEADGFNSELSNIENITGGGGDDIIRSGLAGNLLDGGDGEDWLDYSASNPPPGAQALSGHGAVTVNLDTGDASGGWANGDTVLNFENVIGTDRDDVLIGNAGDNIFIGGGGGDRFAGGAGSDTVDYSTAGGIRGVTIDLSAGKDAGGFTLGGLAGTAHVIGDKFESIENFIGTEYNDNITGDAAENTFNAGTGGVDWFDGDGGVDTVTFEDRSDGAVILDLSSLDSSGMATAYNSNPNPGVMALVKGIENVTGHQSGDDKLTGDAGANLLKGLGGDDTLDGGEGADKLEGGAGSDRLIGGGGADIFVVDDGDTIADFVSGTDKIDLSVLKLGGLDLAEAFIGTEEFTGAGQIRYYVQSVNADGNYDILLQIWGKDSDKDGVRDADETVQITLADIEADVTTLDSLVLATDLLLGAVPAATVTDPEG